MKNIFTLLLISLFGILANNVVICGLFDGEEGDRGVLNGLLGGILGRGQGGILDDLLDKKIGLLGGLLKEDTGLLANLLSSFGTEGTLNGLLKVIGDRLPEKTVKVVRGLISDVLSLFAKLLCIENNADRLKNIRAILFDLKIKEGMIETYRLKYFPDVDLKEEIEKRGS